MTRWHWQFSARQCVHDDIPSVANFHLQFELTEHEDRLNTDCEALVNKETPEEDWAFIEEAIEPVEFACATAYVSEHAVVNTTGPNHSPNEQISQLQKLVAALQQNYAAE